MALEPVKPNHSAPRLPSVNTPKFSGGKLAGIRRKIDEKQLLLAGGIPPQFLKLLDLDLQQAPDSTDLHANIADNLALQASSIIQPPADGNSTKVETTVDKKTAVLCTFCGRSYPSERIELHQRICAGCVEKLRKVPFIVKLGLQKVDGDKNLTDFPTDESPLEEEYVADNGEGEMKEIIRPNIEEEENDEVDLELDEEEDEELNPKLDEEEEEHEEMSEEEEDPLYDGQEVVLPHVPAHFPGGGNNWAEEHEHYMDYLEEAKKTMEMYASGEFPGLPRPPGPNELEVEYVQCSSCLRRFIENYNAPDHLEKCEKSRTRTLNRIKRQENNYV